MLFRQALTKGMIDKVREEEKKEEKGRRREGGRRIRQINGVRRYWLHRALVRQLVLRSSLFAGWLQQGWPAILEPMIPRQDLLWLSSLCLFWGSSIAFAGSGGCSAPSSRLACSSAQERKSGTVLRNARVSLSGKGRAYSTIQYCRVDGAEQPWIVKPQMLGRPIACCSNHEADGSLDGLWSIDLLLKSHLCVSSSWKRQLIANRDAVIDDQCLGQLKCKQHSNVTYDYRATALPKAQCE